MIHIDRREAGEVEQLVALQLPAGEFCQQPAQRLGISAYESEMHQRDLG